MEVNCTKGRGRFAETKTWVRLKIKRKDHTDSSPPAKVHAILFLVKTPMHLIVLKILLLMEILFDENKRI